MVSFVLQQQLGWLEKIVLRRVRSSEQKRWLDVADWPKKTQARFEKLFDARTSLTDAEAAELYALFADCLVVRVSKHETDEEGDETDAEAGEADDE